MTESASLKLWTIPPLLLLYGLLVLSFHLNLVILSGFCGLTFLGLLLLLPLQTSLLASVTCLAANNLLIAIATSVTGTPPTTIEFAMPSALFLMSGLLLLLPSRTNHLVRTVLALSTVIVVHAGLSVPFHGVVALLNVRNLLIAFMALAAGYLIFKQGYRSATFAVTLSVLGVNLLFQILELGFRHELWQHLNYESVLLAKGLGMGVFYSSLVFIGSYLRSGGIYLEPVNLSLLAGFSFATLLAVPLSRPFKSIALGIALVIAILSGGKGGVFVIVVNLGLLATFRFVHAKHSSLILLSCWIIGGFVAKFGTLLLGAISSVIAPHLWAVASIIDTLLSPYALLGHGYGSSGAFHSIASSAELADATSRGAESGVASYIYQSGIIWVALVLIFINTVVRATNTLHDRQFPAIAAALILPWIAAIWQENALSPQALVISYLLLGSLIASRDTQGNSVSDKVTTLKQVTQ